MDRKRPPGQSAEEEQGPPFDPEHLDHREHQGQVGPDRHELAEAPPARFRLAGVKPEQPRRPARVWVWTCGWNRKIAAMGGEPGRSVRRNGSGGHRGAKRQPRGGGQSVVEGQSASPLVHAIGLATAINPPSKARRPRFTTGRPILGPITPLAFASIGRALRSVESSDQQSERPPGKMGTRIASEG